MLRKLLKYDFHAIWRIWWMLAVGALGAAVAGGLALRGFLTLVDLDELPLLAVLAMFAFIGCLLVMIAAAMATTLLVYWRFYKNLYTDEGYLTFTLPASRRSLLLSKTLNGLLWMGIVVAQILVSVAIIALIAPPTTGTGGLLNFAAFRVLGERIGSLLSALGAWSILYLLELLLLLALVLLFSLCLVQFCITVGAVIAKKAKLLVAVGIYYLTESVLSVGGGLIGLLGGVILVEGLSARLALLSPFASHAAGAILLLLVCAAVAAADAVVYLTTQTILERKLNLP